MRVWGRGGHDGAEVAERRALAQTAQYHVNFPSGYRSLLSISRLSTRAQRVHRTRRRGRL